MKKPKSALLLSSTIFLISAYPFLGMIWHHAYPLASAEVILSILLIAVISTCIGLLLSFTRPSVRNLLLILVTTIAMVVHVDLLFVGLSVVLVISVIAAMLFGGRFESFLLIVFATLIVGAWLDNQVNPATQTAVLDSASAVHTRGPVIHLLLDGFISPEGLPGPEESENLKQEIYSFFEEFDFDLNTRAYSHYYATVDSMTRMLNFRNDDENLWQYAFLMHEDISFEENAWFEILDDLGYQINVYQSEFMDYCSLELNKSINCNTFPIPYLISIHNEIEEKLKITEILFKTLASQSVIATEVLRSNNILETWGVSILDERLLQKLSTDITMRPNDAYFAHVLLPHSPQIFREDCSIDYSTPIWLRWTVEGGLVGNSPEKRVDRYKRMVPQFKCALNTLEKFFNHLKQHEIYDNATIIVHGDHGTSAYIRSPSIYNEALLSNRDMLETFSTLFAVKWPDGKYRENTNVESLNVLLAQTAIRLTGKSSEDLNIPVSEEPDPFIYLIDIAPLRKKPINIFE